MEIKKEKAKRHTSPEGVSKYPNVTKPSTKFNPAGVFDTTLRFDAETAKALEAKHALDLKAAIEAGQLEYEKLPLKSRTKIKFQPQESIGTAVYDEATEKPTGEVEFKFKRTASGVSKKTGKEWNIKLPVFDSTGKPMTGVDVWGGTKMRAAYEVSPYFIPGTGAAGVSLKLVAVQVTELVTKGSATAGSFGFEEIEGGYEFTAETDTAGEPTQAMTAEPEEPEDF